MPDELDFKTGSQTVVAFARLTKYSAATGEFEAVAGSERPDRANEVLDYAKSKKHFVRWTETFKARTQGKSLGNIRVQHGLEVAGVVKRFTFDDKGKRFLIRGKIVNPAVKAMVEEGCFTGISVGGSYGETWPDPADPRLTRYEAIPSEISIVDDPCNPEAVFTLLGADGTQKVMKFATAVQAVVADVDDDDLTPTGRRTMANTQVQETAEERKTRKLQKRERRRLKKRAKREKMRARAAARGVDFDTLTKAEKKEFAARLKLEKALRKVEQLVAGPTRGKRGSAGDAIVGPVGADDEGKVGEPLTKASELREADIARLSAARIRDSL